MPLLLKAPSYDAAPKAPPPVEAHYEKRYSPGLRSRSTRRYSTTTPPTNTRLFYNCHIWNTLGEGERNILETEYMKGYQLATGLNMKNHSDQHVSNLQVLSKANRPPAEIFTRITRLTYLPRLILHGPTILLRLLDATATTDKSWTNMIIRDLEWLYQHLDEAQRPTATVDLHELTKAIIDNPAGFRPKVTMAALRFLRLQQDQAHLQQWHDRLRGSHYTTAIPALSILATKSHPANYMRYVCGATFHNLQA